MHGVRYQTSKAQNQVLKSKKTKSQFLENLKNEKKLILVTQNQGKLLAFVIGGGLLLFIGQEAFNGQSGPNNTIGVVMGEEIDAMYYRQEVQEEMQRNRRQRPQLTDADREQIENNVWNRLTMTKVIDAQRKALGIEVTPQEIFDVTSINPDQAIKGAFTDPKTGEFSAALMSDFISNLDTYFHNCY